MNKWHAIIEIPQGDTRRRHWNAKKQVFVDLGPLSAFISCNEGMSPAHYGFIQNTRNIADNDEVDVIVISSSQYKVGERLAVTPIALLEREDADHKVVAVPIEEDTSWHDLSLEKKQLLQDFFAYTSAIVKIAGPDETVEYLLRSQVRQN